MRDFNWDGKSAEPIGTSQVCVTKLCSPIWATYDRTRHQSINNEMRDFNWNGTSTEPIGTSQVCVTKLCSPMKLTVYLIICTDIHCTQANYISPNKRPQSHMSPIIAWNHTNVCSRKIAIGGTNGNRIWTGVVQMLYRLLGSKVTLEQTIGPMTRVHHPLIPNQVDAEGE